VFLKKQGVTDKKTEIKNSLESLTIDQLKILAKRHNVKVKGRTEESFFWTERKPPTKRQYISKLKGVVTEKEIKSIPKKAKPVKKREKRPGEFWGF
jgi:hypothetical protein